MKDVIHSIRRAPYQSLATFLVLFFNLFVAIIMFSALSFLYGALDYAETRPQVIAYFQTKASEKQIFKTREELIASKKVKSIKYVSKEDALKIYKKLNADNPLLLEMVSADILPASLEIYAKKPAYLPEISEFLKKQPGIDEVVYQKDIVNKLITLTSILKKTAFTFLTFLTLMSLVVLTAITLFKIALKKQEIELLQLLGATRFHIRKPFIIENCFFALFASIVSMGIFVGAILYLNPFLKSYLQGINSLKANLSLLTVTVWPIGLPFLGIVFSTVSLFSLLVALLSTYLATNKYLKQ